MVKKYYYFFVNIVMFFIPILLILIDLCIKCIKCIKHPQNKKLFPLNKQDRNRDTFEVNFARTGTYQSQQFPTVKLS